MKIDYEGFSIFMQRTKKGVEVWITLEGDDRVLARTYASDGRSALMREFLLSVDISG